MIKHSSFLRLISDLDEVFQDLVFKLRNETVVNFKIYKTVAVVSFEAIGHLKEVLRLQQLLSLHI